MVAHSSPESTQELRQKCQEFAAILNHTAHKQSGFPETLSQKCWPHTICPFVREPAHAGVLGKVVTPKKPLGTMGWVDGRATWLGSASLSPHP